MNQHSRAIGGDGDFAFGRTHRFFARVIATDHRDAAGVQRKGYFYDFNLRKAGRNVSYSLISNAISPDLRTDVGFVRRTDQRQTLGNISYRWWPETWLISWAPRLNHMRNYQFDGTLQEEQSGADRAASRSRRTSRPRRASRATWSGTASIDFWKTRYSAAAIIATSRRLTITATMNSGRPDPVRDRSVSGIDDRWDVAIALRPVPRFQSDFSVAASRFRDARGRTAGVRRQDSAIALHLSVHRAAARAQYHRAQHARQDVRTKPAAHLSRERGHGLLPGVRHAVSPRRPDQRERLSDETPTRGPTARFSRSCSTCSDTNHRRDSCLPRDRKDREDFIPDEFTSRLSVVAVKPANLTNPVFVSRSSAAAGSTCLRRSVRSWRRDRAFRPGSPSRSRIPRRAERRAT